MGNGRANSPLTTEEEQIICQIRKKTWLPLDDLLDQLKPIIPSLSRSALHRCLKHYNLSTLPPLMQTKKSSGKFRSKALNSF